MTEIDAVISATNTDDENDGTKTTTVERKRSASISIAGLSATAASKVPTTKKARSTMKRTTGTLLTGFGTCVL